MTVLLSSCGDRICVSVQVELNKSPPSRSSQGTQLIDSEGNSVSASRSELHKNHPAKTVVFCRGGNKNKACAYKTIDSDALASKRTSWRSSVNVLDPTGPFPRTVNPWCGQDTELALGGRRRARARVRADLLNCDQATSCRTSIDSAASTLPQRPCTRQNPLNKCRLQPEERSRPRRGCRAKNAIRHCRTAPHSAPPPC